MFIVSADPKFSGPIQNATVAVGRDAVLTCMVEDLGAYKVSFQLIVKHKTVFEMHIFCSRSQFSVEPNFDPPTEMFGQRIWFNVRKFPSSLMPSYG